MTKRFSETVPGVYTVEDADEARRDLRKAVYEFLRHLATLDSAALVLITTLLEKVFPQPLHRGLVGLAMLALMASLVAGGFGYMVLLGSYPRPGASRTTSSDRRAAAWLLSAALTGFLMGMGLLSCFFAFNWFR